MKTNGKYNNLLRAEKKSVFTKRNIIKYSIIGVSIVLFIIFAASLSFARPEDRPFLNFTSSELTELPLTYLEMDTVFSTQYPEGIGMAGGIIVSLPLWGIGALVSSSVGLGASILGSTFSKTMLLENKDWLRIWSKKGRITSHYMFKRVQINLENNRISILKIGNKYRFKIPITEELDLAKFGFSTKNNYYVGYFAREELASTIHVLTTQM